ncbi:MFS transporter [Hoyosella sp. G463]|uniref:MFS transporter n=2 Tax=Lolliginicoccus lacisalsi TaxID=2742202 RepID=A0A927JDS2_9ACTN|nr:MFS transporter [Lolliginicoccus lacisalsi]MBD8506502.1 MFS transporter [Lolliginicoccus lacisalsi]
MLAMMLGSFGIGTTEFVAMGLLPEIARSMSVSEPHAGKLISAYALGVVVGAPIIAIAASRVPRRALLIGLMVAFTLGNAATVLAPTYGTLMAARIVAGLPHGAFFGVAALVAAGLAAPGARARAVAQIMLGLSIANVIGVPVATALGQHLGWRSAFGLVVLIGAAAVLLIVRWVPDVPLIEGASPLAELSGFRNIRIWLVLLTGIVGFGGMFAVYTFISSTVTEEIGLPRAVVPLVLLLYGVGMVIGNFLGGAVADRALVPGLFGLFTLLAVALGLFTVTSTVVVLAVSNLVLIAILGSALVPGLQTMLMDVAGDAQTLAATANHSALNIANGLGAALGGAVLAAGLGYTAPAAAGAVLAVAGIGVLALAVLLQRRGGFPRTGLSASVR